jgi:hypothetical protein
MPSSFSPSLRLELIAPGEQAGTWGTTTNTNLGTLLESSVAGFQTVSVIAADQALTIADGAADQSRSAMLRLTTTTGAPFNVYAPPVSKQYLIVNDSAHAATLFNSTVAGNTTAAGTGIVVPAGRALVVYSDGTNFRTLSTLNDGGANGILVRTADNTVTARSVAVSGTGLSVANGNGVAGNPTITSNATSANTNSTIVARDGSGNFSAGTITASLIGNAATATTATTATTASVAATLQTARNINGTSFNGSADITTANWGSSRTIWGQSINGSADITAPVRPAAGTEAAPAFSTSGDTDTGIHFPAANSLSLVTNASSPVRVNELGNVLFAYNEASADNYARVSILAITAGRLTPNDFTYALNVDHDSSPGFAKNYIAFGNSTNLQGSIRSSTGVGVTYNTSSDYRLKDKIRPLSGGLDRVMRLKPCEWNWKINGSAGVGFIAHEVQAERPQAVSGEKDEVNAEGLPVYQGMDASYLVADLTAAIQELKALVDAQAVEIAALKNK